MQNSSMMGYLANRLKTLHLNMRGGQCNLFWHQYIGQLYDKAAEEYDLWAEFDIEMGNIIPDSGDVYTDVGATPIDTTQITTEFAIDRTIQCINQVVSHIDSPEIQELMQSNGSADNLYKNSRQYWSKQANYILKNSTENNLYKENN